MDDLISRQAAIEVIDAVFPVDPMKSEYAQGIACGAALAKTYVEQLPSAQPERKNGEWIHKPDIYLDEQTWECSECGEPWIFIEGTPSENNANFCPNCGADMRG